jgi:type IV secretory pathway VirB3-like protein
VGNATSNSSVWTLLEQPGRTFAVAVAVGVVAGVVLSLFLARTFALLVLLVLFHLLSSLGGRKEVRTGILLDCWEPKLVRSDVVFYWRGHHHGR